MATAAVGDWIDDFEIIDNSDYEDDHEVAVEDDAHMENAMLKIRDRVVRIGDDGCEHGTVRWMGTFQETGKDLMIGVELDNPKGSNNGSWGNEQLFLTAPDHGLFIPAMGLIKESEFMGENSPKKSANPTNDSLSPAETDVLNDSFYDNISYGLPLDGMEMNANAEPRIKRPRARLEPRKRASLEAALRDEPNSIEITKLLRQLELAICQGHCQQASQLAHRLAMFKISCSVIRKRPKLEPATEDEIFLNVFVEDKSTHIGPFQLYVTPLMTVKKLKQTFQMQFDFPSAIQRWILGKQLAADDDATLSSYGIDCNGCPVFLYLMASEYDEVEAYREKLQNYLHALDVLEPQYLEEIDNKIQLAERERRVNDDIIVEDIEHSSPSQVTKVQEVKKPEPEPVGWKCPACTCINFPTRPGCTACATSRPEDYVIPPDYEIPQEEQMRILIENQLEIEMRQEREKQREENYQKILEMELQDVVLNDEVFECFVCFDEVEVGEGIRLRDCLHTFCRRCLAEAVEHNETAEVKCPYIDDNYSCPEKLQDREIRQIVSHEIYERHLQRSIATAENQAENSFHCKNADCRGWCIYEDDINEFLCPVCQHLNCLTCQAIHEQLNCRQYQDRLELEASNNDEAKKTKELLDRMLTRGEAMRCPKCQIILMKKWGCDWLKCSMCQTEICWITRGPRWGPNGTGDTSGGCRCGVNGKKCHPGCNYCH